MAGAIFDTQLIIREPVTGTEAASHRTTTAGFPFSVSLSLAAPPAISHVHLHPMAAPHTLEHGLSSLLAADAHHLLLCVVVPMWMVGEGTITVKELEEGTAIIEEFAKLTLLHCSGGDRDNNNSSSNSWVVKKLALPPFDSDYGGHSGLISKWSSQIAFSYRGKIKFVDVDKCRSRPSAIVIRAWTLQMPQMVWKLDDVLDVNGLWGSASFKKYGLHQWVPEYPVVSLLDPHIVHFVLRQPIYHEQVWMITVDMRAKSVVSCKNYPNGENGYEYKGLLFNPYYISSELSNLQYQIVASPKDTTLISNRQSSKDRPTTISRNKTQQGSRLKSYRKAKQMSFKFLQQLSSPCSNNVMQSSFDWSTSEATSRE
uniref:DUF1618 domain-containing protein n=1 Tax=Oryza meridionalis TaxID=40149 RepID=A0A0E0FA51_9ORYZ